MMGRLKHNQEQLFYSFCLGEAVPGDHPVRAIAAVLDLSWVHSELVSFYSRIGRQLTGGHGLASLPIYQAARPIGRVAPRHPI